MKLATLPTKMGAPSPLLSTAAALQIQAYIALLHRTAMICVFAVIAIERTYENENQSVFDNNKVFKTIGVVALSAVAVVAWVLLYTVIWLELYMRDICYTMLKLIGSFSAFLAPFSLLMVLVLPPELNWIAYLVVCVVFGMIVTCFYLDDQQQDKRSSAFNLTVPVLVLVLIMLALLVPKNLIWIVYPVIYLSLGMESAYHVITCLMFIYEKTRKPRNLEVKAHQLIHPTRQEHQL